MKKIYKVINKELYKNFIIGISLKERPKSELTKNSIELLKQLINENNIESEISMRKLYHAGAGKVTRLSGRIPFEIGLRLGILERIKSKRNKMLEAYKLKEYNVDEFVRNLEENPRIYDHDIDMKKILRILAKAGYDVLDPDDDYSELF